MACRKVGQRTSSTGSRRCDVSGVALTIFPNDTFSETSKPLYIGYSPFIDQGNPMGSTTTRTLAFVVLSLLLLTASCATLFAAEPVNAPAQTIVLK